MPTTNYTLEMLAALEKAIASGSRQVMYGNKMVMYRDLNEMLKIRDLMRVELGITKSGSKVKYGSFSKGLQ